MGNREVSIVGCKNCSNFLEGRIGQTGRSQIINTICVVLFDASLLEGFYYVHML